MPRPNDLMTLCEAGNEFPFGDWESRFGPYRFFYVAGLRDVAQECGIRTASDLKQHRLRAIMSLPQPWRDVMPDGEWQKFAGPQIDLAWQRNPMRFDKAVLSILALEAALREQHSQSQQHVDYLYRHVRVRPAIYQVLGFKREHLNGNSEALRNAALQQSDAAFTDMTSEGNARPVTHNTAAAVAKWLNENGYGTFTVSQLMRRDELPARCKSPAREHVAVNVPDPPHRAAAEEQGQGAA